ncbi:MAG: hypothetical protein P8L45_04130 [Longimicrobiales bacterium]|nr:hypothetical protein [Longimicrobiales bacterium]
MSLHDEYTRTTPWELAFESTDAARQFVAGVSEESEGRGADPEVLEAFLTMGAVDYFIRGLEGAEGKDGALARFGGLAFHAYHFTNAGCPVYLLSVHATRYLVEGAPNGVPEPPAPSGYLQLPQHLFWAGDGSDESPPESIDGLFWMVTSSGLLHSMLVTGLRPDRPGIGVVPLPPAPLRDAAGWLDLDARGDVADFTASLPGGELDGLYGVSTAGEVFKLLARFFAYAASVPDALAAHEPHKGIEAPEASSLPFTRVRLSA